jgi:hypothetical protein
MIAAIKEYGVKIPILARSRGEEFEIVDGHLQVKALKKMEMTTLPVIFCDDWSDAQVKAFRLLVNRSATWATWDEDLLPLELKDLDALDFDLGLTGLTRSKSTSSYPPMPQILRQRRRRSGTKRQSAGLAICGYAANIACCAAMQLRQKQSPGSSDQTGPSCF